jgi:hypothetical protein
MPQHFRFPEALRQPIEIGIHGALRNAETAQLLDNTNLVRGRDAPGVERLDMQVSINKIHIFVIFDGLPGIVGDRKGTIL